MHFRIFANFANFANFADPDPSEALRRGGGDAALPAGRRVCATPAHLAKSCLADKEANEIMD